MLGRLTPRLEWILVNLICFGPLAALSIHGALQRKSVIVYDDRRALLLVGIELACGAAALLLLRARGWRLADLGFRISMPLTIAGMILFVVANVTIAGGNRLLHALTGFDPGGAVEIVPRVSYAVMLLMLAVDPLYEETFEVAYNVRALEGDGAWFAITFSTALRFVCHLWQGPIVPLTIVPLGIIFAAVYWRWRRVWPLAVAHGAAGYFFFAGG
jgi:uncharacterized protein